MYWFCNFSDSSAASSSANVTSKVISRDDINTSPPKLTFLLTWQADEMTPDHFSRNPNYCRCPSIWKTPPANGSSQ